VIRPERGRCSRCLATMASRSGCLPKGPQSLLLREGLRFLPPLRLPGLPPPNPRRSLPASSLDWPDACDAGLVATKGNGLELWVWGITVTDLKYSLLHCRRLRW
jgi:hypothetical protein